MRKSKKAPKRSSKQSRLARFLKWRPSRKLLIRAGLVFLGLVLLVQLFYPGNRALPFEQIEGRSVSGWSFDDLRENLNSAYKQQKVEIYVGKRATKPHDSPTVEKIGLKTSSDSQIDALKYPWLLRLVPSSLLWANAITNPPQVATTTSDQIGKYVDEKLMATCKDDPDNATFTVRDEKLVVVDDVPGGRCTREGVVKVLSAVVPRLDQSSKVQTPLSEIPASFQAEAAHKQLDELVAKIGDNVPLQVESTTVNISEQTFIHWLDFTPTDERVLVAVSADKASEFLSKDIAPKVALAAGTTHITTRDFTEVSREEGTPGRELDVVATAQSMTNYLQSEITTPLATTRPVAPKVTFTRTYSSTDTGLNALLENYAKDNSGTWGISMAEISGKGRRASYNGDKQFVTASTYKLFTAYSVLRRIDAGTYSWADESSCFNKMISQSDNACAEYFQTKLGGGNITKGARPLTDDAVGLGLKNTTFLKEGGPYTTADDLVIFLGSLEASQSLRGEGRSRLISAMLGNVYRNGIPAGTSGRVADKVGFMGGLLHDAAIVYSPNGTYVLAVMTDGSSWSAIAELTKQIERVRA